MGTPQDTHSGNASPCPLCPQEGNKIATDLRRQAREGSQRGLSEQAPPAMGKGEKGDAARRGKRGKGRNRGTAERTKLFDTMQ